MPLFSSAEAAAGCRPVMIVLSHLRWDLVVQRPHHLLSRAAADFDIWFLEEPVEEGTVATVREGQRSRSIHLVQPVVPLGCDPAARLAHQQTVFAMLAARAGAAPLCLWFLTPMALEYAKSPAADLVIYDKMDEQAAQALAPPGLADLDAHLLATADLVLTGGASLQAAAIRHRADAHLFPSSIDVAHFTNARGHRLADPESQRKIPFPRIGYFGVIDERMDRALVAEVAAIRPDWQLVMIGPTAGIDSAVLPQSSNIHWLGARDYASLPRYLAHWDLAWMPFARNAATRHISPIKTLEYLAAGLAVISTPIVDVVNGFGRAGLVEIALDAPDVVACGRQILADAAHSGRAALRLAAVDAHLAGTSWDRTWAAIRALMFTEEPPASDRFVLDDQDDPPTPWLPPAPRVAAFAASV